MSDDFDKSSVLKIAFEELERARLKKGYNNKIEVRVGNESTNPLITSESVFWDKLTKTEPSLVQDLWVYRKAGNIVMQVLVTYQNSAKKNIIDIQKTVI